MNTGDFAPRRARSLRIVLAEDDDELRDIMADILRGDGHEVFEAADGLSLVDAVDAAVRTAPLDLVISDQRMPLLGGLEAMSELRRRHRVTPFVLVTAFADSDIRAAAARLGAAVVSKPVDVATLRRSVVEATRPAN